jgi:nucleotide-binding universal stress UspA family protein
MLTLKHILVPTDFSETSEAALEYGIALASGFGAKLWLLHVLEKAPAEIPGTPQYPLGLVGPARDATREWLSKILTEQHIRELKPALIMRVGAPHVEIVRYAKDRDVDLIVMGTHGRGFMAHMLMGSVAENVVRRAPCSVLTVRCPQHEFVAPDEPVASVRAGD